jgi:hypothetical protein
MTEDSERRLLGIVKFVAWDTVGVLALIAVMTALHGSASVHQNLPGLLFASVVISTVLTGLARVMRQAATRERRNAQLMVRRAVVAQRLLDTIERFGRSEPDLPNGVVASLIRAPVQTTLAIKDRRWFDCTRSYNEGAVVATRRLMESFCPLPGADFDNGYFLVIEAVAMLARDDFDSYFEEINRLIVAIDELSDRRELVIDGMDNPAFTTS